MPNRTTHCLAVLLLTVAAPLVAREAKPSFDLSLPLAFLSGIEGNLTLGCGDAGDSETTQMIQALQRQGRRGHWESREDGDRLTAVRRGEKFRLRAWEDGSKKLDLKMPWEVAECLFGGRESESLHVSVEALRDAAGFRLQLAADGELDVSIKR